MKLQKELNRRIAAVSCHLIDLKNRLNEADKPARDAYNREQRDRDLPNWQIRSWEELTEEGRDLWRNLV